MHKEYLGNPDPGHLVVMMKVIRIMRKPEPRVDGQGSVAECEDVLTD
jgi:hypothetical protein